MPEQNPVPSWVKEWRFKSGNKDLVARCCEELKKAKGKECAELLLAMSKQLEAATEWCNFLSTINWADVPGTSFDSGGGGGTPPPPPKWPPA